MQWKLLLNCVIACRAPEQVTNILKNTSHKTLKQTRTFLIWSLHWKKEPQSRRRISTDGSVWMQGNMATSLMRYGWAKLLEREDSCSYLNKAKIQDQRNKWLFILNHQTQWKQYPAPDNRNEIRIFGISILLTNRIIWKFVLFEFTQWVLLRSALRRKGSNITMILLSEQ